MSVCDDSQEQILKLQEENARLQKDLEEAARLRKAGETFTKREVGNRVLLPGVDGVPREIDTADVNRGLQQVAGRMKSQQVEDMVARGLDQRRRPVGADGEWLNYDQILEQANIDNVEDFARLGEALGIQWKEMAPSDYAFVTEVYDKERIAGMVADAYKDLGVTMPDVMARMANDAAGFSGLTERMTRIRLLADRSKSKYLDTLKEINAFMEEDPGALVPTGLKGRLMRQYKLALASHRHSAYARRRTGQTLRSLQEDMEGGPLDFTDASTAEALGITPADVKPDSHIGRVIEAIDNGPAGQIELPGLIQGVETGSIDPLDPLDEGWFNSYMRTGQALAKDSQLFNLNTQVKPNLGGNIVMSVFGPVEKLLIDGYRTIPYGTKGSRMGFIESAKINAQAAQYAMDAVKLSMKDDFIGAFKEGKGHYSGNTDTYGKSLKSNDQDLAEVMQQLNQPYVQELGPLNPVNWAVLRGKLQASARLLAQKAIPGIPLKPGFRMLGAADEVAGKFAYLFHLKSNLEIKARSEGTQLGLFDDKSRDEWVTRQLAEAVHQATPSESQVKAYRKQMGLRSSDATDDEIIKIMSDQELAGAPTLSTEESRAAMEYSMRMRFQQKQEGFAGAIGQGIQDMRKHWAGDALIPYWKTPFNAMVFDNRLSSFALLDTIKLFTQKNPSDLAVAQVKAAWTISGALFGLFGLLDAGGHITGSMDPDPNKRNRIGPIPYLGGIPILNSLFLWKDLKDAATNAAQSQFDGDEVMGGLMQVLTGAILRQTGFSQIQQLTEGLMSGRDAGEVLQRYLGFMGAGQIPGIGIIRNIERGLGVDRPSLYNDGKDAPGTNWLAGDDGWLAGVEKGLRDLAFNTMPGTAALGGVPKRNEDWLGSQLQLVYGMDLNKGIPFFPRVWPNDPVYAELDAQGLLDPPAPLLTRKLDGVGMSDNLQDEFQQIYSKAKGDSVSGRFALTGQTIAVKFPMPTTLVLPSGVRITKDGGASIPIEWILNKHVKGKTVQEAFRSLFKDPIYKAMEEDSLQSASPGMQDQPKHVRRGRPAQLLIAGIKTYYELLTRDELQKRAANGTSPEAKQWSDNKTRQAQAEFQRSLDELDPGRKDSWLIQLRDAVK